MRQCFLLILMLTGSILAKKISKLDYVTKFLPEDAVVVEAGASWGQDTPLMAKKWPRGKIYAFEPIKEHFTRLKKNTSGFSNVTCYEYGLSNQDGNFPFYVSELRGKVSDSSSLLRPKEHIERCPVVKFTEVRMVDTLTLDSWAEKYKVDCVDFLWLDLQGSELDVLRASPKILKTVKAIWTEASYGEMYEGCGLYPELKNFLENHGFKFVRFQGPTTFMFDALFVRNDVYDRVNKEMKVDE